MAHSPRYEAAWRDLLASVDAHCTELKAASPRVRRKALAAVGGTLREPGSKRLPLVREVLAELRWVAGTR